MKQCGHGVHYFVSVCLKLSVSSSVSECKALWMYTSFTFLLAAPVRTGQAAHAAPLHRADAMAERLVAISSIECLYFSEVDADRKRSF